MSKHTPGPWKVDDKTVGRYAGVNIETCLLDRVASAGHSPFELAEKQANARLIAAAPELLGWLKAVVRQMEYERPKAEKIYTNGFTGLFGMQENLEAIIAKAEGKNK